jgi:Cofactor assembly of complex C subunit B
VNTPVISTAFLMTVLTFIGLLFFIRASVKDRTKQIKFISSESETTVLNKLQKYFEQRAYQIVNVDTQQQIVTFQGFVRPSLFLTILLTALAGLGLSSMALVLSSLYPNLSYLTWLLLALAPIAGIFYWRRAGRREKILLAVESEVNGDNLIVVTAHRDELIQLQENLSLPTRE